MHTSGPLNKSLKALKARIEYVNKAWTVDTYERLLRFYVHIVPKLLDAERCSIFILDPSSKRILSKIGTALDDEIEAPTEGSIVGRAISSGEHVVENDLTNFPGFHRTADARTGFVTRSVVCAPIKGVAGERITGAVEVLNKHSDRGFDQQDTDLVVEIADYLSMAVDNILISGEIGRLSSELNREMSRLQSDYLGEVPFIAESDAMRGVLELVRMVCDTPVNVLIQGENGTGKEVIARMIHEGRDRRTQSFVPVNCAAIPEHLMESEFFGYEKGVFTGAVNSRKGRFEEADGGTLFLDEVADIPLSMQPKFLRAIQENEGARLGSNRLIAYNASIISATNRNLRDLVETDRFRQDLFYRLFAVEIVIPPLRERREDIASLTVAFVDDVCRQFDKTLAGVSQELITVFEHYPWPGNVRQLRREVERAVALTPNGEPLAPHRCSPEVALGASDYDLNPADDLSLPSRVRELEMKLIRTALERTAGGKSKAAEVLGITRQGLHKKLKRYAI